MKVEHKFPKWLNIYVEPHMDSYKIRFTFNVDSVMNNCMPTLSHMHGCAYEALLRPTCDGVSYERFFIEGRWGEKMGIKTFCDRMLITKSIEDVLLTARREVLRTLRGDTKRDIRLKNLELQVLREKAEYMKNRYLQVEDEIARKQAALEECREQVFIEQDLLERKRKKKQKETVLKELERLGLTAQQISLIRKLGSDN